MCIKYTGIKYMCDKCIGIKYTYIKNIDFNIFLVRVPGLRVPVLDQDL